MLSCINLLTFYFLRLLYTYPSNDNSLSSPLSSTWTGYSSLNNISYYFVLIYSQPHKFITWIDTLDAIQKFILSHNMGGCLHYPFQCIWQCSAEWGTTLKKIMTSTVLYLVEVCTKRFPKKEVQQTSISFLESHSPASTTVLQNVY